MTCAPLVSSFSLKREEDHKRKVDAICKLLGFVTHAQYYRWRAEKDFEELCTAVAPEDEETPDAEENPFAEPDELAPDEEDDSEEEEEDEEEERRGEEAAELLYEHPDAGPFVELQTIERTIADHLKEWRCDSADEWAPMIAHLTVLLCAELGEWEAGELIHEYNKRHQLTTDYAKRWDYFASAFRSHYIARVMSTEAMKRRSEAPQPRPVPTKWEKRLETLALLREQCTIYSSTYGRDILLLREHSAVVKCFTARWEEEDKKNVQRE